MYRSDISKTVISRLPRYFRYLGELKDKGTERISSTSEVSASRATAIMLNIFMTRSERSSVLTDPTIS